MHLSWRLCLSYLYLTVIISAKKDNTAKISCQYIFLLYVCDNYFIISIESLRKSIMNSMNYKVGIFESITQKKKLPPSRRIFRVSQEVGFESSRVQDGQVVE